MLHLVHTLKELHSSSPEMCSATHFAPPAHRQWLCHCHPPGTHRWLYPTWVPCMLQLRAALFGSSWATERPFLMPWGESFPCGSCARPVVLSRQPTCWLCGRRQYSGSGGMLTWGMLEVGSIHHHSDNILPPSGCHSTKTL